MNPLKFDENELDKLDEFLFNTLINFEGKLPKRFGKFLAMYYPDARIRKKYANYIGVEMGEQTYSNLGLKVVPNDNKICVHIGKEVSIAPNVVFICESCANNGTEINELDYVKNHLVKKGDIIIEDNVWIGTNVTIMPGVTVGRCSIIGAGSIVFDNVDSFSIYAGVPAKKIRDLKSGERTKE